MLYITTYLRRLFLPIIIMATLAAGGALSACSNSYNRAADDTLHTAEAIMDEHPDSALSLICSIDPSMLKGERRRALHALLLTQARDKNYIDQTSDSIISIATAYFDNSRDLYHRMLAHYYLSRVYYYAGNYVDAAREAEAALYENSLNDQSKPFWEARLYHNLSQLANLTADYKKSVEYASHAIELFDSLQLYDWETEAKFSAVRSLRLLNNWDKSESIMTDIDIALLSPYSKSDYDYLSIGALIHNKKWDEALRTCLLLQNDSIFNWDAEDDARLGYIYSRLKNFEKADSCINQAYKQATCKNDTFNISFYQAKIELLKNHDFNGLERVEFHLQYAYEQAIERINNHLAVGSAAFHKYRAENETLRSQLYSAHLFLSISIFLIALGIVAFMVYRYRKQKESELNSLTLINRSLRCSISELERHENSSRIRYNEIVTYLKSVLETGFGKINKISKKTFASKKQLDAKDNSFVASPAFETERSFITDYSKIISELDSAIVFDTLRATLNNTENNIIDRFLHDFPTVTEQELKLIILIFSNVGSHTICLILRIPNLETLRNRKARLKRNIEKSDSQFRDIYLNKF